jgi:hypothetical protein
MADLNPGLEPRQRHRGCRIESFVARGGMGVIYRARSSASNAPSRSKVVAPELARDETCARDYLLSPHAPRAMRDRCSVRPDTPRPTANGNVRRSTAVWTIFVGTPNSATLAQHPIAVAWF